MSVTIQNAKFGIGINPVDSTGATTDGTAFDTLGLNYAVCILQAGNVAANSSACKLQESDDNSSWSDVTGGAFTAPAATGGDNTIRAAFLACGGSRKRYFRVTITGGAGATLVSATWIGTRANQSPNSATERGLTEQVILG